MGLDLALVPSNRTNKLNVMTAEGRYFMLDEIRNSANGSEEYFRAKEVRYLISIIDQYREAWEVMANIPMGIHSSEIRDFAKKMLKGQKPYALEKE